MRVDFNVPAKGLDGVPEKNNMNKLVAQIIGGNTDGDAWKFGGWAFKVYGGEVLELDKTDFEALKGWLTVAAYPAVLKFQVLEILEGVK